MRVGIYVRVSTQEQAKEGYSIGEQIERLGKYCDAMQWTIVAKFIDPGYSGGDMDRPGLRELIDNVEAGKLDKVVVYKLDRLSRSQKDTLFLIEDVFLKNGTDFVSMNENFDTSTPFGRAMIGILAVFAQLEREQIKERMAMGKEARVKSGKWPGGSTEPIGYDYDPSTDALNINEYEAMQIRELYELFLNGTPIKTIEKIFAEKGYKHKHGTWATSAMRNVMRNKINIGYVNYSGESYPGLHDPIIDDETYTKAVKLLDDRLAQFTETGIKPGAKTTFFGGLLICKHCGGKYTKQANYRRRSGAEPTLWYMCYSRCKKSLKMIKDPTCKNKNWKMVELDKIVFDEIKKLALDPDYYHTLRKNKPKTAEPNKIEILEKEIENIDAQISRFMDLYGIGKFTIDQVSGKVDPLNETRRKLQKELDDLNVAHGVLTEEETREIVENIIDVLDNGDFNEIRAAIESIIRFIEIDNEDITIHWKFI